jgi:tryptophan-rich sensory protein
MNHLKHLGLALLFLLIAFLPSLGAFYVQTGGWYEALSKPSWNPPAYLFGPVWSVLYLMIGLSGYFAWMRGGRATRPAAFVLYGAQLFLNALWTPLFFGWHQIGGALVVLSLLWLLILLNLTLFRRRSLLAAGLLLPYLLWVAFAGALNAAIWMLN